MISFRPKGVFIISLSRFILCEISVIAVGIQKGKGLSARRIQKKMQVTTFYYYSDILDLSSYETFNTSVTGVI